MKPEEQEFRESCFDEAVGSDYVRARVLVHVSFMAGPDDAVAHADLEASRPYLRRCMDRMSYTELMQKSPDALASLWARGALGASRYRQRGGRSPGSRRRPAT